MAPKSRRNHAFLLVEGLGLFFVLVVGHAVLEQPYRRHLHQPLQQAIQALPSWSALLQQGTKETASVKEPTSTPAISERVVHAPGQVGGAHDLRKHAAKLPKRSMKEPCRSVPMDPPLIEFIGSTTPENEAEGGEANLLGRFLNATTTTVPKPCGFAADSVTAVVLLYHKMGTVWWQHAMRVTDYANWLSVFTVDSGDGMSFLEAAAALAAANETLCGKFPGVVVLNNPRIEELHKLDAWIRAAGRQPRYLLQVRDFRDVLVSGFRYHLSHVMTSSTSEAWLHTPQPWWGDAVGAGSPIAYQDALRQVSLAEGAALEMTMVRGTWEHIAQVAHEPLWADTMAFVTYEDMWRAPGIMIPRIMRFFYGELECNAAAARMARGFLAYTAGFRQYTEAAAQAAEAGVDFDPEKVDLDQIVAVLAARGTQHDSTATDLGIVKFLRGTYGNAGRHFRKGKPGNWATDELFDAATRTEFADRFQCLLEIFRYEQDRTWLST